MNVPFLDFSGQYHEIKKEVTEGLEEVFKKGNFILGQPEKDFEAAFAKYCGVKHSAGVASGTDALHLALRALDIGPGDEVIVPAFTFVATVLAVSYVGAKPVFADVQEDSYNLDPEKLKEAITDKTKAVIPVHLYGQMADMQEITEIVKEHKIKVIEDSCQAHGAVYQNRRSGSMGDAGCFSFYPTKGLGAFGDGGIVTTGDQKLYEKIMMLRDYGRTDRYSHALKGYNSRLDTVQAVVLSAKLKNLDKWNGMRAKIAQQYIELFSDRDEIVTPATRENRTHVYQTFAVRVPNRDDVIEQMKNKGVGALIHYPIPLHLQPAYKDAGYKEGDFPVSENLAKSILSLPMFPHMTKEQVEYVAHSLKELVQSDIKKDE